VCDRGVVCFRLGNAAAAKDSDRGNELMFASSACTVSTFLLDLGYTDRCTALPCCMSPLALVTALVRGSLIAEAACVHWSLLAMPPAMYRSDTACELLSRHVMNEESRQLPFYFVGLSEVTEHTWGWNNPWE
jgi:hypothetical protein